MAVVEVKKDLYWVGVQDHDLRVFDVIMHTEYGTSYNSYILKTEAGIVLFETAKAKWFDTFISNIKEICDPSEIAYIVVDHTEPDHAGSLEKLLDLAPNAKVLASSVALTFLKGICNREIPGEAVPDNHEMTIGNYTLQFLSVPFLHWPDSIYTFIKENNTLVTCDSFGCHYADDKVCNDLIEGDFVDAYQYYFNMIMGPFKEHVQYALERIKDLEIETICPGHGPVLREKLDFYIDLYDKWSKQPKKAKHKKPKVTMVYVAAYGYTETIANEIRNGILDSMKADVQLFDMVHSDHKKVLDEMIDSDGVLVGSPTINGDALPPIMDLIMQMNGVLHGGKVAGSFGSYGWSGEAADMLMARLNVLRMKTLEPPVKINFKPSKDDLLNAFDYGKRFARKLKGEWEQVGTSDTGKTLWKCTVCGEIFEGALPPMTCPVCGAGQEAFVEYVPEVIDFTSEQAMKVVIVGGGAAAVYAADSIRKRNKKAQIDIYSRESSLPYYRPVLTKAIAEDVGDHEFSIFPKSYYCDNNINIHAKVGIMEVLPDEKKVQTGNGELIEYDKLVLATGSRSFMPPLKGIDLPEVVALREVANFDKLKEMIGEENKSIAIIGGGLLGLETAYYLTKIGQKVTILENRPRILPRQMDESGGRLLKRIIEKSSVEMKTGVYVEEIAGAKQVRGVLTDRNEYIPCDIVIISAGVRSNVELAASAGIEIDRGIVVNERMQTSNSDIYAVGDCAICNDRFDGIWETAVEQGKIAGANIAGDVKTYKPKVFGATLNAFGTGLFSLGDIGFDEDADYVQVENKDEIKALYKKLYFKDDVLAGGILLGDLGLTNTLLSGVSNNIDPELAMDNKLL